jgi:hypothetical protein
MVRERAVGLVIDQRAGAPDRRDAAGEDALGDRALERIEQGLARIRTHGEELADLVPIRLEPLACPLPAAAPSG